jgi:hypothetical protein
VTRATRKTSAVVPPASGIIPDDFRHFSCSDHPQIL